MDVLIYQPSRSVMQSGTAGTNKWVLEYTQSSPRKKDPLMGWTSSSDTQSQVKLDFNSKEEAIEYAIKKNLSYSVRTPKKRKPVIRPRGYAENFAFERRDTWTH